MDVMLHIYTFPSSCPEYPLLLFGIKDYLCPTNISTPQFMIGLTLYTVLKLMPDRRTNSSQILHVTVQN